VFVQLVESTVMIVTAPLDGLSDAQVRRAIVYRDAALFARLLDRDVALARARQEITW